MFNKISLVSALVVACALIVNGKYKALVFFSEHSSGLLHSIWFDDKAMSQKSEKNILHSLMHEFLHLQWNNFFTVFFYQRAVKLPRLNQQPLKPLRTIPPQQQQQQCWFNIITRFFSRVTINYYCWLYFLVLPQRARHFLQHQQKIQQILLRHQLRHRKFLSLWCFLLIFEII